MPAGTAPDGRPLGRGPIRYARPVGWVAARSSAVELPEISRRRVLLDILLMAVAYLAGLAALFPVMLLWRPADDRWLTVVQTLSSGATVLIVCLTLMRLERQGLGGLLRASRHFWLDVVIGVGGYFAVLLVMTLFLIALVLLAPAFLESKMESAETIKSVFPDMTLPVAVLFMGFVALWEEVAFRGFLLTRLQVALKRWWLSVPAGALLFGLGHVWQGPVAAVQTVLLGLVLGLLFLWRRNLVPCVVLHAINNTLALLLLRYVG
ncbi:MAG: CPBP family intramembrane metalloprotease [Phycisphaerae bacterium]